MLQVLRTLVITLLAAGLLGGGIWLLQRGSTGLRKQALGFMDSWWAGESIEGALSTEFEGVARDPELRRLRTFWKKRLGKYVGPGDVVSEDLDQNRGSFTITLHFEEQDATAHFGFVQRGPEWKITRFRLDVPRHAGPGAGEGAPQKMATRVLELWATNETAPIREMFSADLRRGLPAEDFAERTKTTLLEFGTFQNVEFVSSEDDGDELVRLVFKVVFSKGPHEARLSVIWRGGHWRVHAIQIEGLE